MKESEAFVYFLVSLFLFIFVAWIVHQKLIDLSHRYTRDNTALDELAFRELLVSNILIGIFMLSVACFLYFAAVFSNPYLSGYWVHLVHYFQVVIYEVSHGLFVL